jgi:hypothetical protein
MSTIDSIIIQLTSGILCETDILTEYLQLAEIKNIISRYNWIIRASTIPGWTTLIRQINYSS